MQECHEECELIRNCVDKKEGASSILLDATGSEFKQATHDHIMVLGWGVDLYILN